MMEEPWAYGRHFERSEKSDGYTNVPRSGVMAMNNETVADNVIPNAERDRPIGGLQNNVRLHPGE
jgi:hypothetical protein